MPDPPLKRTALHALHVGLGARMAAFAGYELPVTFAGAIAEHLWTRRSASLFDVSHMRVCDVSGADAAAGLERVTPSRVTDLAPGRSRYLALTDEHGGIVDDTVVTARDDGLRLVCNAARADDDLAHLRAHVGDAAVTSRDDLGLLALQGPVAGDVLAGLGVAVDGLTFMHAAPGRIAGIDVDVSRSGYTGEDGFELTAPTGHLTALAGVLLDDDRVALAGLAARDSLRLEAGLCLYGADLDTTTTVVEAGLLWTVPSDRRDGGDYLGAEKVAAQVRDGAPRRLVGLRPAGRRPVRGGSALRTDAGVAAGSVTSGGWGPTIDGPVALGYVDTGYREPGTRLVADVRGSDVVCDVVRLPFVAHGYVR